LNPRESIELPPGYQLESLLHSERTTLVVRAARAGESVVLRMEQDLAAAETISELFVLGAVDHPGVAPLIDHGPLPGGGRYLARRWIEGADLLGWSRDRMPEEIGRVVAKLCPALEHLHRAGFVHRDLKAENVIVSSDGNPVLCDFGLARRRSAPGGGVSGTLFSIAPEELLGLEVGPSADLFALGAMIHRLLAPARCSAREFYASFPQSSFLDAAGTDPEELPSWARDLVASLTARDPRRRPASAAEVGRLLADRLGVRLDPTSLSSELRWPVSFARDAWIESWMRAAEDSQVPQWIRLPPGEHSKPFWEHLRLHASLRGRPTLGIDLAAEVAHLENGVALDSWAARTAKASPDWIALWVDETDVWKRRALESLERACELERIHRRKRTPRFFAVGGEPPISERFQLRDVPPVDAGAAKRFVERNFPSEAPERRADFAERLALASRGSATRADVLLARFQDQGAILPQDPGFRLRPGEIPEAPSTDLDRGTSADPAALDEGALEFLLGLSLLGDHATAQELALFFQVDAQALAPRVARLRREGWIEVERRAGGLAFLERSLLRLDSNGFRKLRSLHERRARQIELRDGDKARSALHRFFAEPGPATTTALCAELAHLRELGRGEKALEIGDELERFARALTVDLPEEAPELLVERARAWCALVQTEFAARTLDALGTPRSAELAASIELVRGQIASLRNETERAFAHFERAPEIHPSARIDAAIGRIQLLHALGRDDEVLSAIESFAPRELEREGRLSRRQRVFVESRAAMSAQRLGRVEEALARTRALIEEIRPANDPGLEAALLINLAIIERGAGSLAEAHTALARAIELYDRAGLVAGLAHAQATLGGLLREEGNLLEAEPLLLASLETRHRLSDLEGAATARGMLGLAYFERGRARAAIETLEGAAAAMSGAQKRRHAPVLVAKALEMRVRIGDRSKNGHAPTEAEEADPRILLARARASWMSGDAETASVLARRAAGLAASLKLARLAREAEILEARLAGTPLPLPPRDGGGVATLADLDERIFDRLRADGFDPKRVERLALELEQRGRDDRAARLWFALSARSVEPEPAQAARERAESLLAQLAAGLSAAEAAAFRMHLLGEPDPWPGDFTRRSDPAQTEGELEMEIVALLDINRQLVRQKDLESLLGVIVEKALEVTGAERGFLVLEEHGELRFDTALDSLRGDIAQPELEISGGVVREALEKMKLLRVSNAVDDPLLGQRTSVVSLELRSILCVPFEVSSDLRGAIYVDHRLRKGAFDERAEKLCALLADQAALAIQQLRRMDEIRALNRELERRVLERETDLREARRVLEAVRPRGANPGLVGRSQVLREVRELIAKVAPSDLPALVVGPSGTGKELAARSLHDLSPRRSKPFVSESCAALPASLIESELFGHRRGAFTGADRDRVGRVEEAHGGTLFLDEIGELPLDLQAKLLRVLETGEVRRLGESEARKVDFRLVAATNRDLEREVREGRFRSDLFYRLNGVRISMPSLAERPEDIAPLVEHFLEAEAGGKPPRRASKRFLTALARRTWPGNVRELKNEIARLCVLTEGDLDDPIAISAPSATQAVVENASTVLPIAELERRAILQAIERAGGDKRLAAQMLGISRAKLYQRLKEWRNEERG